MFITQHVSTYKRNAFVNITADVREAVRKSAVKNGTVTVYSPHTTAGITINEGADPDVAADLLASLETLVPDIAFEHTEGNSDSHLKTLLTGTDVTVPIQDGEIALGTWQVIYFCEFDGPRKRRYHICVHGS